MAEYQPPSPPLSTYLGYKVDNEHGLPGLGEADNGRVPATLSALRGEGGVGGGADEKLQQLHDVLHEWRHVLKLFHSAYIAVPPTGI